MTHMPYPVPDTQLILSKCLVSCELAAQLSPLCRCPEPRETRVALVGRLLDAPETRSQRSETLLLLILLISDQLHSMQRVASLGE